MPHHGIRGATSGSGKAGRTLAIKLTRGALRLWALTALSMSLFGMSIAALPHVAEAALPVIVDTDIYSNADDVGALASAFALQLRGEANVIAVTLNTTVSRPTVATNSWKCVAAIDNFYGSSQIPIGTQAPVTGADPDPPGYLDFLKPCGQWAPASTPVPDDAVSVDRRALASQADGSVVMISIGYEGNLKNLLQSGPDANSSLNGVDLVRQKVSRLVVMGGAFPVDFQQSENNLSGDVAAAQYVSANWPTKLVWSGREVGDQVYTGQTVSSTHPPDSPVRAAFEAYTRGMNNWMPSFDHTAVYYAVRPDNALLEEVGPGTNTVSSTGGTNWTVDSAVPPTADQYYLNLRSQNVPALDQSIELLLDTLPSLPQAQISGTVTDASTNDGIAGASVQVYDLPFDPVATAWTAWDGDYAVRGLSSGTYTIVFAGSPTYRTQLGLTADPTYLPQTVGPVSVNPSSTTAVNASMAVAAPPLPRP
jgi:purine nucleosidase